MTSTIRRLSAVALAPLFAAALVIAPAVAPVAAATTTPVGKGLEYVALGDSYAAGLGLDPDPDQPVSGCAQGLGNYPRTLASLTGLSLTDMTCSAAETKNLIGDVQNPGGGTNPVQTDALSASTRIVTITIGGNDLGFISLLTSCIALSRTGPTISGSAANCAEVLEADGTYDEKIATTVVGDSASASTGLTAAFSAVRKAAPNADVFVIGYPSIMPDAANTPADGCYRADITGESLSTFRIENGFPFTDVDVEFIRATQQKLDAASAQAAEAAGFTYVSTLAGSAAHSACQTDGTAYVNGVTFQSDANHEITMPAGALHPNAAGEAFLADSVLPLVEAALTPDDSPTAPAVTLPGGAELPIALIAVGAGVLVVAIVLVVVLRRRRAPRT